MNSTGPSDVSPEAMQARIQQARREAESLKDRIKRKKDELADTTRMLPSPYLLEERHDGIGTRCRLVAAARVRCINC